MPDALRPRSFRSRANGLRAGKGKRRRGSPGSTSSIPHAPYRPPPPFDATVRRPAVLRRGRGDRRGARAAARRPARAGRPTLVIVTGDHGEGLGDHGEESHGLFAYESTLRIPLIMAEIGGARGSTRSPRASWISAHPEPVEG